MYCSWSLQQELGFLIRTTNRTTKTSVTRELRNSYKFLVNWLERFPEYRDRDFFITGESYAGHYAPQLARTIISKNNSTKKTKINLKGIAVSSGLLLTLVT